MNSEEREWVKALVTTLRDFTDLRITQIWGRASDETLALSQALIQAGVITREALEAAEQELQDGASTPPESPRLRLVRTDEDREQHLNGAGADRQERADDEEFDRAAWERERDATMLKLYEQLRELLKLPK
jgi:hypothetical protein